MKLVNYIHSGCKGYGIYTDEGIIDLRKHIGDEFPTLKDFLSADFINIANKYIHCPANVNVKEITFLPVIDNPEKIICVGMNYAESVKNLMRIIRHQRCLSVLPIRKPGTASRY